jgi:hypothetical protein
MLVLAAIAAGLIYWKVDLVQSVYFRNQLTDLGLVINGLIVALFAIGLLRMIASFLVFMREEAAIGRFLRNIERRRPADILKGVAGGSIIARRYRTMQRLHQANTPINQNAMASALVADESTRTSFPKFINNILILTGVFGTIVSLSIALLGASDLLENAVSTGGMGMVVHGMSTALSTTITAIVCYVFFGYFYLKLTDAQTNLVSAVEQISTTFLIPRFQVQTESVLYEFTGLIRSLQELVQQMESSQKTFAGIQGQLLQTLQHYDERAGLLDTDINEINRVLKIGFRLRDDE